MSKELATTTEDYLVKRHKEAMEAMKPQSMANRSPKKWMLCARYIIEDGLNPTEFMGKTGQTRNNYYDIKRFLETANDYEQIRSQSALEAATDYEIGVDLERKYTEKMFQAMASGDLEINAQGYAQIQRGQSLKAERFQKFSGAATQHVVVEHVVSQEEYETKADELKAKIAKAKAAKAAEVIDID
tara:strand:+ start:38 stop:595 length:558 start_codon:yes stop_codon:yes gene_type:complete